MYLQPIFIFKYTIIFFTKNVAHMLTNGYKQVVLKKIIVYQY